MTNMHHFFSCNFVVLLEPPISECTDYACNRLRQPQISIFKKGKLDLIILADLDEYYCSVEGLAKLSGWRQGRLSRKDVPLREGKGQTGRQRCMAVYDIPCRT